MNVYSLRSEERKYTYTQSTQIMSQTGCIGHLRADMGSDGEAFFSSWNDHRGDLNTPEFKEDIDRVINTLREDLLKSRGSISKYCSTHPEASFGNDREWGARVDTDEYAYLMRLNPNRGEYNLYCYCYKRAWLNQHLEKAENGIRFIDPRYKELFRVQDGQCVRISYADGKEDVCPARYIDDYHVELDGSISGRIYHICELAEMMERAGAKVEPVEKGAFE